MQKEIKNVLGLGLLIMASVLCRADAPVLAEATPLEKSIIVLPMRFFEELEDGSFEHHYFSGQKVYLPVLINQDGEAVFNIKAELTQKGFSLEAPLSMEPVVLSPLKDTVPLSCRHLLSLELPEVKRRTTFLLNLHVLLGSAEQWQPAGEVEIHVYPRDIVEPLKDWSKKVQLRLCDPQGQLARFLEEKGIAFVDYRAARPKEADVPIIMVVVGDKAEYAWLTKPRDTVIHLREKSDLLRTLIVRPYQEGMLVDASLKFLDTIADAPRSQEILLEIMQLTNTFNP